ncbi:hypothetical protein BD309DRAFT_973369 [Dichomitus squalens]|nr:hypothetical protein BD309DRAFT_973369 [Dichomitus squalens]
MLSTAHIRHNRHRDTRSKTYLETQASFHRLAVHRQSVRSQLRKGEYGYGWIYQVRPFVYS